MKQAGAQGTVDQPPNPWDPEGGWNMVYDGQTFSGDPLVVDNQANVLIINCAFQNIKDAKEALFIKSSERVLVLNNTFTGHRYQGHGSAITVGTDGSPAAQVIIENNTIRDEDGNGVATGGSSTLSRQANPVPGLIIRDNLIHDVGKYPDPTGNSPKHGMYVKATDPLVENNVLYNCFDGSGLSIRSTGIYRNNVVWNTKGSGLAYWPQKDPGESGELIIENNVVYQNGDYSGPVDGPYQPVLRLGVGNAESPRFNNFTVRFNTVVTLAGSESRITGSVVRLSADFYTDVKAYGNLVVDLRPNSSNTIYQGGGYDYTYFGYNYTAASDEGFANLANRNFRLTANHPASNYIPADAGLPSYPTTDQEGNARQYPLSAGAYTLTGSTEPTPTPGSVTVRARGTTGEEQIVLRFNDQPVGEPITLDTSYQEYPMTLDQASGNFKVVFVNDDGERDVYVDWLEVGNVRRQAELQDINTGAWANEVCGGGTRTEVLHCNGYIDFGTLDSEVAAGQITVGVAGKCGGEDMRLKVDGTTVATWYDVGTDLTTRTYPDYTGGSIRVEFFDNGTDEAGCNRNLLVDYVVVEGIRYETEEVATAHPEYADCNTPDVMRCNGYYDFGDLSTSGVAGQAPANRKLAIPEQATSLFQAYPNPASDQLTVQGSEDYQVRAYDLNGRPVMLHHHLYGQATLNVSHLSPGIYLLNLRQADGQSVQQRLIIE